VGRGTRVVAVEVPTSHSPRPTNVILYLVIVCGSTNPSKLEPVKLVFSSFEPTLSVIGVNVRSFVPDQPMGWTQTTLGARNRARGALEQSGAVYGVGLEGGFVENDDGAWLLSVAAVVRSDGLEGLACGGWLRLPDAVAARVKAGEELSRVIDDLAGERATNTRGGAIGFLTLGRFTRAQMWAGALELALAPISSAALYSS
jgi:inosine/xanthosine triphosphatase